MLQIVAAILFCNDDSFDAIRNGKLDQETYANPYVKQRVSDSLKAKKIAQKSKRVTHKYTGKSGKNADIQRKSRNH